MDTTLSQRYANKGMTLHKLVLTNLRLTNEAALCWNILASSIITETSVLMKVRYKRSVAKHIEIQEDSKTLVARSFLLTRRTIGSNILSGVKQC